MVTLLPIDSMLEEIGRALEESGRAVLVAEPGAGKTTRVPPSLMESLQGAVWVLQPRRLAALVAARRVAEERGWKEGTEVGWHFRFDHCESKSTRLLFLTEGMFLRRLQSNPTLEGVGCVVLDEFHERSLDADLGLALLRRMREKSRPDMKILIMSATIDSQAVALALGGCPVLDCKGRVFPVEDSYLYPDRTDENERLEKRVLRGLKKMVPLEGDALVFLPGVGEIRRSHELLRRDPAFDDLEIVDLHGGLTPQQQRLAIAPSTRTKIILTTNVAETSLTVPGVRVVLDAGLARRDSYNPYTGLASLVTLQASRASMDQRRGRAGRVAPGRCLRLCSAWEYKQRPASDRPEVMRAELSSACLQVMCSGLGNLSELPWLDPPETEQLAAAAGLLESLGAVSSSVVTERGRRMSRMSLHPRLAAMVAVTGTRDSRERDELARAVALLSEERLDQLDFWAQLKAYRPRGAAAQLAERCREWARPLEDGDEAMEWKDRMMKGLALAFADQVGWTKKASDKRGETKFLLCAGGQAVSKDNELHLQAGYYLLLNLLDFRRQGEAGGPPKVQSLVPIPEEWLLEGPAGLLREELDQAWDKERKKVNSVSRVLYGELVIDEGPATGQEAVLKKSALLYKEARKAGLENFCGEGQPGRYLSRRAWAMSLNPGLDLPGEEQIWACVKQACDQGDSFNSIRAQDPFQAAIYQADAASAAKLETLAPKKLRLSSGRELSIQYEQGKSPWIQAIMHDFFGMEKVPEGIVVHLLGPNRRPLQVTSDLSGFWTNHYPKIKQELQRKYPRHRWPDDPAHAEPVLLKKMR